MLRLTSCLAGFTLLVPLALHAQEPVRLEPGARIRLSVKESVESCDPCIGELISLDESMLKVRLARIDKTFLLSDVTRLELSTHHSTGAKKGAIIGGAIGGSLGLLLGMGVCAGSNIDCESNCNSCAPPIVLGLVSIGGLGAALGLGLGSTSEHDDWIEVPAETLRVGVGTDGRGVLLGVSICF